MSASIALLMQKAEVFKPGLLYYIPIQLSKRLNWCKPMLTVSVFVNI